MRVVKVGAGEEERREGEEMEKGMVGKEGRGEKKGRRGEEEKHVGTQFTDSGPRIYELGSCIIDSSSDSKMCAPEPWASRFGYPNRCFGRPTLRLGSQT